MVKTFEVRASLSVGRPWMAMLGERERERKKKKKTVKIIEFESRQCVRHFRMFHAPCVCDPCRR